MLGKVATVVIPVRDQQAALDFYTGTLGMTVANDFRYETGEWWLEVSPAEGSSNLCLVASEDAGIETGVVLSSTDVEADRQALQAAGVDVDDALLTPDEVVLFAGAPLAGMPAMFRLRDPDGNVLLVVAAG